MKHGLKPIELDVDGVVAKLREMIESTRVDEALGMVSSLLRSVVEESNTNVFRLIKALRNQYGRKSEKVSPKQLMLALQGLCRTMDLQSPIELPPEPARREKPKKKARPHGRRALPAHLPRVEERVAVPEEERTCEKCGAERVVIGYETSEVLEYVPASFTVRRVLREKRACAKCGDGVVVAPVADKVIERGLPGAGMLAKVVEDKYQDHLPLHRQAARCARLGCEIPRSTLSDWVRAATDILEPLWKANREAVLVAGVLQADGTHLKVLDREHPNNIKRGSLWCFVGDGKYVHFEYAPNESREGPLSLLRAREGPLVVDADTRLDSLFGAEDARAYEVGCWMHGRRRFVEALKGGEHMAAYPLDLIRRMYAVEEMARGLGPDEVRALRQQHSKPVLDALWLWMAENGPQLRPSYPLAQAIGYAAKNRVALSRFVEDGRLPIDNGACERAIRAVAVGRRNYLFAGSDAGGKRAAIAYSLLGSCALLGVNPWAYLKDVFEKLSRGWPKGMIFDLLPADWAEDHPEHVRKKQDLPEPSGGAEDEPAPAANAN